MAVAPRVPYCMSGSDCRAGWYVCSHLDEAKATCSISISSAQSLRSQTSLALRSPDHTTLYGRTRDLGLCSGRIQCVKKQDHRLSSQEELEQPSKDNNLYDGQKVDMDWCISIPKVELHAHLNGSFRPSTLLELASELDGKDVAFADFEDIVVKRVRSLSECFKLFDLVHMLTTDHSVVTKITKEVVEDFAMENTIYLELRTTPKKNEAHGMTKRSYMEAVLQGLRTLDNVDVSFIPTVSNSNCFMKVEPVNVCCKDEKKKIYVRLLLSIDRRETMEAALETVLLALDLRKYGVVGIDLSGNPMEGEWQTFLPALMLAREEGLSITLHCGEIPNPKEIKAMLDFRPQRIGHACCFEESEWRMLKLNKIPVEICLTSNVRTNSIPSVDVHHFDDLYKSKHPIILCTDDKGIFSTSLSLEYHLASMAFGLDKNKMFVLAGNAVEFIFADESVKEALREAFSSALR